MNKYLIWYIISNISNNIKVNLLKKFKSIEKIWYYSMSCDNKGYMSSNVLNNLKKAWDLDKIKKFEQYLLKNNIGLITILDKEYPNNLKEYKDAPFCLFYKGDISKINKEYNVAIVGARDCTNYGKQVALNISKKLSRYNINIISGMAYGIDGIAQRECINNEGYTCAVLGSGIDVVYPKRNFNLYNDIIKKGCVISEFLPGTKPYSYNFPIRNRIISGISDLVIVIEASEKSGSLITAQLAIEQGKDVVAVPGSIFSSKSMGTNKLIRDGAYPFTDFYDLFYLMKINYENEKRDNCIKNFGEKGIYKKINNIINEKPIHVNDILKQLDVDIKQLYEVLFEMQLNNQITCLAGNYYVKINSI